MKSFESLLDFISIDWRAIYGGGVVAGLLRWLAVRHQSLQVMIRGTDFHCITVTLFIVLSHGPGEATGLQSDMSVLANIVNVM